MTNLSVIIPVFNESAKVRQCYEKLHNYLVQQPYKYQIVFVNDGSTDDTREQIISLISEGDVKAISYQPNFGKGHAVKLGLINSKYAIKVVLDCDLSVSIDELSLIDLDEVLPNSLVKGVRKQVIRQPIHRIIAGKAWKVLVYLKTGMWFDTQCPFWILHLRKPFYEELTIDGFAFDIELLSKAKMHGSLIKLQRVSYRNDPDSRVTFRKTLKMLKELLSL